MIEGLVDGHGASRDVALDALEVDELGGGGAERDLAECAGEAAAILACAVGAVRGEIGGVHVARRWRDSVGWREGTGEYTALHGLRNGERSVSLHLALAPRRIVDRSSGGIQQVQVFHCRRRAARYFATHFLPLTVTMRSRASWSQ